MTPELTDALSKLAVAVVTIAGGVLLTLLAGLAKRASAGIDAWIASIADDRTRAAVAEVVQGVEQVAAAEAKAGFARLTADDKLQQAGEWLEARGIHVDRAAIEAAVADLKARADLISLKDLLAASKAACDADTGAPSEQTMQAGGE